MLVTFVNLVRRRSLSSFAAGGALGPSKSFKSIEEMVGQLIFLATTDNQPSGGQPAAKAPESEAKPEAKP
jgi:phospholipid/cholesterol/gamma-HCH transport system substrate-binding protein